MMDSMIRFQNLSIFNYFLGLGAYFIFLDEAFVGEVIRNF